MARKPTPEKDAPTLDDVLALVPDEHRDSLEHLRAQLSPDQLAVLEDALPRAFRAIESGDYRAFEEVMDQAGYGPFAFLVWSLLTPDANGDDGS